MILIYSGGQGSWVSYYLAVHYIRYFFPHITKWFRKVPLLSFILPIRCFEQIKWRPCQLLCVFCFLRENMAVVRSIFFSWLIICPQLPCLCLSLSFQLVPALNLASLEHSIEICFQSLKPLTTKSLHLFWKMTTYLTKILCSTQAT